MEIKHSDLKIGDKVWACAYDYNYNRTEKALIQQPVFGQIVQAPSKAYYKFGFAILKKDGTPRTSGIVDISSRSYAATEDECIEIYNQKIRERIAILENDIKALRVDLL